MPADSTTPTPDPVPSPAPAATPSPAAASAPPAPAEPTVGASAAPPPASDKAPALPPIPEDTTPKGIVPLGEGDALDRLTAPTEKPKENTPAPAGAPAAPAATPDTENKDAPPEPAEGEEVPFKDADEKELAGYHSRTRHRIKQYQGEVNRLRGAAQFTYDLAGEAAKREMKFESIIGWQKLGFGIRDGDPEALEALAEIVESHGLPLSQPAAPDLTPIETAVADAFRNLDINEAAKNQILGAVAKLKTPAPQQQPPQQRQAPAPRPQQAPSAMQQTVAWVRAQEAQIAQRVGAQKAPETIKAIYDEAKRREAHVPIHLLNDPIDMRIRFAACAEHVLAKASQKAAAPAAVPVQPSLRASTVPLPPKIPAKGTPEYDDFILSHGIPQA